MSDSLHTKLQYRFRSQKLLQQALMHSSYANEHQINPLSQNERLEFLGDAVLELISSETLYTRYPELMEGDLTKFRASIVCESMLAQKARSLALGDALQMGKGESQSGGRDRDSILADAFEALIGAIYLDGGLDSARAFILHMLDSDIRGMRSRFMQNDCKTFLQEQLQQNSQKPIEYTVLSEAGPDHNKQFTVSVSHGGKPLGQGTGKSKKEAEQSAAQNAIEQLGFMPS